MVNMQEIVVRQGNIFEHKYGERAEIVWFSKHW